MSPLLLRLRRYDRRLLNALVLRRSPTWDRFMRGITHLADWPVAVGIVLFLVLGPVTAMNAPASQAAWTLALAHLAVEVLKRAFTRERPQLPVGFEWLVGVPDRFSFPSGHATAALSLALPLALALPVAAGVALVALGLCVGVSRAYLGVHYPGDILAGWALSLTAFSVVRYLGLGV